MRNFSKTGYIAVVILLIGTICVAQQYEYTGNWKSLTYGATGSFTVSYTLKGSKLKGEIKVEGSAVTTGGEIEGKVEKDSINFGLVSDKGVKINYKGAVAGDIIEGTYTAKNDIVNDKGIWKGRRPGAAKETTPVDYQQSYKCEQIENFTTYYFKNNQLRIETATAPGIRMYDLLLSNEDYYKVMENEQGIIATKMKSASTYQEWYIRIVVNSLKAQQKGESMDGVPFCTSEAIPDSMFELPISATIIGE
ncbi:MAG: hypothetical protein MI922_02505 [Bacteroidales bacterium]|nr:hypothetical protein [Bacteroidales bacterium]